MMPVFPITITVNARQAFIAAAGLVALLFMVVFLIPSGEYYVWKSESVPQSSSPKPIVGQYEQKKSEKKIDESDYNEPETTQAISPPTPEATSLPDPTPASTPEPSPAVKCEPLKSIEVMCKEAKTLRKVEDYTKEPDLIEVARIREDNQMYARLWPRFHTKSRETGLKSLKSWPWLMNPKEKTVNMGGEHLYCAGYEVVTRSTCPMYVMSDRGDLPGMISDNEKWLWHDHNFYQGKPCASVNLFEYEKLATVVQVYPSSSGHFPNQVLPRILLMLDTIPKDVPILLAKGRIVDRYIAEMVKIGIVAEDRLIEWKGQQNTYKADILYFARSSAFVGYMTQFGTKSYNRVREKFKVEPSPENERYILVTKRETGARAVSNHDDLVKALEKIDKVKIFEPGPTLREDIDLWRYAYISISPHGAGLCNMMWQAPGTAVVEMCYDGSEGMVCPDMYYHLGILSGLDYWSVLSQGNYGGDMKAPIEEIVKIVKQVKAEKEANLQKKFGQEFQKILECDKHTEVPKYGPDDWKNIKVSDTEGYKNRNKIVDDSPYFVK